MENCRNWNTIDAFQCHNLKKIQTVKKGHVCTMSQTLNSGHLFDLRIYVAYSSLWSVCHVVLAFQIHGYEMGNGNEFLVASAKHQCYMAPMILTRKARNSPRVTFVQLYTLVLVVSGLEDRWACIVCAETWGLDAVPTGYHSGFGLFSSRIKPLLHHRVGLVAVESL